MDEEDIHARIERLEKELKELKLELSTKRDNAENQKQTKRIVSGDLVEILNPRKGQEKTGTVVRVGSDTNYVTVNTKSGKVVRLASNVRKVNTGGNHDRDQRGESSKWKDSSSERFENPDHTRRRGNEKRL
jgi:hypothetical protein